MIDGIKKTGQKRKRDLDDSVNDGSSSDAINEQELLVIGKRQRRQIDAAAEELYNAVKAENVEKVREILDRPNAEAILDWDKNVSFHLAMQQKSVNIIYLFCTHAASKVKIQNDAISWAFYNADSSIVTLMLRHFNALTADIVISGFKGAAIKGQLDIIQAGWERYNHFIGEDLLSFAQLSAHEDVKLWLDKAIRNEPTINSAEVLDFDTLIQAFSGMLRDNQISAEPEVAQDIHAVLEVISGSNAYLPGFNKLGNETQAMDVASTFGVSVSTKSNPPSPRG